MTSSFLAWTYFSTYVLMIEACLWLGRSSSRLSSSSNLRAGNHVFGKRKLLLPLADEGFDNTENSFSKTRLWSPWLQRIRPETQETQRTVITLTLVDACAILAGNEKSHNERRKARKQDSEFILPHPITNWWHLGRGWGLVVAPFFCWSFSG